MAPDRLPCAFGVCVRKHAAFSIYCARHRKLVKTDLRATKARLRKGRDRA